MRRRVEPQSSQAQKVVSTTYDESERHGTHGVVATCMCDHPSTFLCVEAWICSSTHPGRHWPACFDQTCGYPGEGPLTTLGLTRRTRDVLDADTRVHDVRHDEAQNDRESGCPNETCKACWSTRRRRHNGLKCSKCHGMGMQRGHVEEMS